MPKKIRKTKISKQNLAIIVLGIITTLLIIVVLYGSLILRQLWYFQKEYSSLKVTTLILQANEELNKPAPVDAQTGKVYIPETRLFFNEMPEFYTEIKYRYNPKQDDFPEELTIVNTAGYQRARATMIGAQNMEDTFNAVPELQACGRGYQLSFIPVAENTNPLIFNKTLSDGRVLYVYLDSDCTEASESLEKYLKQIDSY